MGILLPRRLLLQSVACILLLLPMKVFGGGKLRGLDIDNERDFDRPGNEMDHGSTAQDKRRHLWDNHLLDVVFLVDGSKSIGPSEWQMQRIGIMTAVLDEQVVPRNGNIGVSVIQYASTVRVELPYTQIASLQDLDDILQAMGDMVKLDQGGAHKGGAVHVATNHMADNFRPEARQVFCLMTDGIGSKGGMPLDDALQKAKGEQSEEEENGNFALDSFSVVAIDTSGAACTPFQDVYTSGAACTPFQDVYTPHILNGYLDVAKSQDVFDDYLKHACFDYPGEAGPVFGMTINKPQPNQEFQFDERIRLKVTIGKPYQTLIWAAENEDGETKLLPTIKNKVWLHASDFYFGKNVVTATATNSEGLSTQAETQSVVIHVHEPPVGPVLGVTINQPQPNQRFLVTDRVKLKVTVDKPYDAIIWTTESTDDEKMILPTTKNKAWLDASDFYLGQNVISATATKLDGELSSDSETQSVVIYIDEPELLFGVTINQPQPNQQFKYNDMIKLKVTVEKSYEALVWETANEAGEKKILPSSKNKVWLDASEFYTGKNVVSATVTETTGSLTNDETKSVAIFIDAAPQPTTERVVKIETPTEGAVFTLDDTILLECTAVESSLDEQVPDKDVLWFVNGKGYKLGKKIDITGEELGVGVFSIEVEASGSGTAKPSQRVGVEVEVVANEHPTVEINKPWFGNTFLDHEHIFCSCFAFDTDDGVLDDDSVLWSSNRLPKNKVLGTGCHPVVDAQDLPLGRHMITVTATDKYGAFDTDGTTIWITEMPEVRILKPHDGDAFSRTERIRLVARATLEDGQYPITDSSVLWMSNVNGEIGKGKVLTIPTSSLAEGTHEISVTAADSLGRRGVDNITIVVAGATVIDGSNEDEEAGAAGDTKNVFNADNDDDDE